MEQQIKFKVIGIDQQNIIPIGIILSYVFFENGKSYEQWVKDMENDPHIFQKIIDNNN